MIRLLHVSPTSIVVKWRQKWAYAMEIILDADHSAGMIKDKSRETTPVSE